MNEGFNAFYARHKRDIRLLTSPECVRDLYFAADRDTLGFDLLPEFFDAWGVDWSVSFAAVFEAASGLRSRLDTLELATFRMIFDRHMVNLSKARFDAEYIDSSDERALYLIYKRIAPVRVCSAMAKVKDMTFDYVHGLKDGPVDARQFDILSALGTLFYIELNHIMRVYIYYAYAQPNERAALEVVCAGDDVTPAHYMPPFTNSQMAYPDNPGAGSVELF